MAETSDTAIPANVAARPFWYDTLARVAACPALDGEARADLAVVGGGFTGLWTALFARRRNRDARIVLLEAGRCGDAASGRNGGFCAPSISHGIGHALQRWPAEAERLIRLGRENLDEMEADLAHFAIATEFERTGKLNVAATPWQVEALRAMERNYARFGIDCTFLEGPALRRKLDSPLYVAGLFEPNYALLNPSMLVAELRRVCLDQGVEIYEDTPVQALRRETDGIFLKTPRGQLRAPRVALATNAAPPLLRRLRPAVIPVYDYILVTEPLRPAQLQAIGWTGRYGVTDGGNQFHYLRKTADDRILWGGYDAIYHFGSRRDEARTQRPESFARLARQFAEAFPPLADVSFTHAWGGVIDTSARTTFFGGTAAGGRVAYAMGFTGQGVSASRFAGLAMLDMLDGITSARTELAMLRRAPFPFPPEPLRSIGIWLAQRGLAREDRTGKRSLFLKSLDAIGIGFES